MPTTKDATHLRISFTGIGLTVHCTGGVVIQSKKAIFLQNPINKQQFIHHMSQKLQMAGCRTDQARHDADLLIVQTAIATARQQPIVLIGDNTDLLVLLLYHGEMDGYDLFLASEPKQHTQKNKVWYIKQAKHLLRPSVCDNILFMHAILGCDTTSRLFGLGKGLVLKKIQDPRFYRTSCVVQQHRSPTIGYHSRRRTCFNFAVWW